MREKVLGRETGPRSHKHVQAMAGGVRFYSKGSRKPLYTLRGGKMG